MSADIATTDPVSSTTLVLVLNAGSSSLKYQLLDPESEKVFADGVAQRIGEESSSITHEQNGQSITRDRKLADHQEALEEMLSLFADNGTDLTTVGLTAVGHRVVHGGQMFYKPTVVDEDVINDIDKLSDLAPLHNPVALDGVRAMRKLLPDTPSVCVFDTAFFHNLPKEVSTYAIDREIAEKYSIRRYGFHGTSHQYVSGKVAEFLRRDVGDLNQIIMHLGNGASISAIRGGSPVETSMGLTPMEGLVMGTRSGDVDPGVLTHLARAAKMSSDDIDKMLNKQSGLKGLCGENDFRELSNKAAAGDEDAKLAYDVYIHRLRKYIGAYMLTLGRVDVITFTAGVGENASDVRADAMGHLAQFGIKIDPDRNAVRSKEPRKITTDDSGITVLVVPTNEELSIARQSVAAVEA